MAVDKIKKKNRRDRKNQKKQGWVGLGSRIQGFILVGRHRFLVTALKVVFQANRPDMSRFPRAHGACTVGLG